jgi:hypothetical protein
MTFIWQVRNRFAQYFTTSNPFCESEAPPNNPTESPHLNYVVARGPERPREQKGEERMSSRNSLRLRLDKENSYCKILGKGGVMTPDGTGGFHQAYKSEPSKNEKESENANSTFGKG